MSKKVSNPPPPEGVIKPTPPPKGPPLRMIRLSIFGDCETKESIRAREDYDIYIKAYMEGLAAGRCKP